MSSFNFFRCLSLPVVLAGLCLAGCGPVDPSSYTDDEAPPSDEAPVLDEVGTSQDPLCSSYCGNCVLYARCRQPRLPYGLTYWSNKVAVINSASAHPGCVAMIPSSNVYGHAAYVAAVNTGVTPHRITLNEANWQAGQCSSRTGTKDSLNIRGYWCP